MLGRLFYYDAWLPNTGVVKLVSPLLVWHHGWKFLLKGLIFGLPATLGYLLSLWRTRTLPAHSKLCGYLILVWLGYIFLIGGDIFLGYRAMLPIWIAGLIGMTMYERCWLSYKLPFTLMLTAYACSFGFNESSNASVQQEKQWFWSQWSLAKQLKRAMPNEIKIAVTAAGGLPFWTKFDSIDMLGLNEIHEPKKPTTLLEKQAFFKGHMYQGLSTILPRNPDLILFSAAGYEPWVNVLPISKVQFTSHRLVQDFIALSVLVPSQKLLGFYPIPKYVARFWVRTLVLAGKSMNMLGLHPLIYVQMIGYG